MSRPSILSSSAGVLVRWVPVPIRIVMSSAGMSGICAKRGGECRVRVRDRTPEYRLDDRDALLREIHLKPVDTIVQTYAHDLMRVAKLMCARVAANGGRPAGRGGVSRHKGFSPSTRWGCSRTGPAKR